MVSPHNDQLTVTYYSDTYSYYTLAYDIASAYGATTPETTATQVTLRDLQPNTAYNVSLYGSTTSGGDQTFVASTVATTSSVRADILVDSNASYNALALDWTDNEYTGAYYRLACKFDLERRFHTVVTGYDANAVNVSRLFSNTLYEIRLYGSYAPDGYYALLATTTAQTKRFSRYDFRNQLA